MLRRPLVALLQDRPDEQYAHVKHSRDTPMLSIARPRAGTKGWFCYTAVRNMP
jgi:hypothetical protein